jgi:quercetin dioxygenase-like cupin family protein
MQISRNTLPTGIGPAERFTGHVYVDMVATPIGSSRINCGAIHFAPGARTAWHTHPHGQIIYVTEGLGVCQRRGGSVEVLRPGDRVYFEPGEDHWHGAAPNRFMVHIAMLDVDDNGTTAVWGDPVTDEEYGQAPDLTT